MNASLLVIWQRCPVSLSRVDPRVARDLLALAPFHVNAIPTSVYAPDWRFLLRDPARGLKLVTELYERCVTVLRSQVSAVAALKTKCLNTSYSFWPTLIGDARC